LMAIAQIRITSYFFLLPIFSNIILGLIHGYPSPPFGRQASARDRPARRCHPRQETNRDSGR
jgi:hypothetical protein